ncbi:MAG: hypothetical protein QOG52_1190 [Frankiaceae bacterium]|nr:hypothetical protein [Frankiaceae bacterium]
MTTTEDRLRAALHARAELVSVPAHRGQPAAPQPRGRRVLVAIATAATVAAIVTIVTVTLHVSSPPDPGETLGGTGTVQPISGSPLTRRELASAAWTGSSLLIWGGKPFATQTGLAPTLTDGAVYDPVTDSWQPAPNNPATSAPSLASATVTVGSIVYTFGVQQQSDNGGFDAVSARFDPATTKWSTLAAPPLCATAAAVVGERINVAGFICSSMAGTRVPVWATYDTASGQWSTGVQPPPTDARQLLIWHGGILAVGFYGQCEFLAPGASSWTGLPPVPDADITGSMDPGMSPPKVAVGVLGDRLIAVTRVRTAEKLSHIYAWDDRTATWGVPVSVAHDGPADWHWAVTTDRIAWIADGGLVWIDKFLTPNFVSSPGVSSTDGAAPTLTFLGSNTVAYWGLRVTGEPTNTGLLFHLPSTGR